MKAHMENIVVNHTDFIIGSEVILENGRYFGVEFHYPPKKTAWVYNKRFEEQ